MSMRIAMGVGSEVIGTSMRPQDIVDNVVRAEADGFGSAWSVHFSPSLARGPAGSAWVWGSCRPTRGTRWPWPSRRRPPRRSAVAG
jgi:hypothetical protein